jgi:hypothetical protein
MKKGGLLTSGRGPGRRLDAVTALTPSCSSPAAAAAKGSGLGWGGGRTARQAGFLVFYLGVALVVAGVAVFAQARGHPARPFPRKAVIGPARLRVPPTAAVMLGGLLIGGLQPDPRLFVVAPDFVGGLIAIRDTGNLIGVARGGVVRAALRGHPPHSVRDPDAGPRLCAIGASAVANSMVDVWSMLGLRVTVESGVRPAAGRPFREGGW